MIIGITEVKPKYSRYCLNPAEISLPDYELFHVNVDNKVGRGVALYVHKSLNAAPHYVKTTFQESVWIEIKLNQKDNLLVGCIYRSDSGSDENNINLRSLIKEAVDTKHSHLLVMGDFNYREIQWETWTSSKEECRNFIECIRDSFLFQHVMKPTRGRINNEPTLLDLIMTNEEGMMTDLEHYSPLGKSDHAVLKFNFICYTVVPVYKKVKYYYDRGNYEALKTELGNTNWEERFKDCTDDVQKQWEIFDGIMKDLEKKHIPNKVVDSSAKKKGNFPIDQASIKKIKKKHNLWKKYMETKDGKVYQEYCRARNQIRALTRKMRNNFEKGLAKEVKKNPKALWKYINSKSKTREGVSDLNIDPTNTKSPLTKSDQEKAQVLGNFFTSVFTNEPDGDIPESPEKVINEAMGNLLITEEMVKKKLNKLRTDKSPGPDKIHPRFLKELANEISIPITIIFNTSLRMMELPVEWRQGQISAIFKKGNRKLASNYRPVSLTSIICKTMEHVVREHIITHMKRNKLFSEKQYGFISGRSTVLQLLEVMNKWTETIDQGYHIDTVYMDFMKAFDTVPHRRLIGKLASHGINNPILGWIKAFLTDRKQQVQVNGSKSEWMDVTSGIPQGSVLGPVLFVIYINDLPDCIHSETYLFADDTKIFRTITSEEDCKILQEDLKSAVLWSEKWLLRFHPDKCKSMSVGNPRGLKFQYELNIEGKAHKMLSTENEKDIGVTIDPSLNFEKHINEKVNKANSIFAVIRRSYMYLDKETFKPLYIALIRSHLEYANNVWSPYKQKDIDIIENVQRRATKQVIGLRDLSYPERLKLLNLPTLTHRRTRGDMIEVYKLLHNKYDTDVSTLLKLRSAQSSLRGHSLTLFKPRVNRNLRQNSFTIRVIDTWNSLPQQVVEAPSVNSFKNRLDKYWKDQESIYNYKVPINRKTTRFIPDDDEEQPIEEHILRAEET